MPIFPPLQWSPGLLTFKKLTLAKYSEGGGSLSSPLNFQSESIFLFSFPGLEIRASFSCDLQYFFFFFALPLIFDQPRGNVSVKFDSDLKVRYQFSLLFASLLKLSSWICRSSSTIFISLLIWLSKLSTFV